MNIYNVKKSKKKTKQKKQKQKTKKTTNLQISFGQIYNTAQFFYSRKLRKFNQFNRLYEDNKRQNSQIEIQKFKCIFKIFELYAMTKATFIKKPICSIPAFIHFF
jgi:hypothetical protein